MKIAVFTKNRTNPAYAAARLGADRAAERLGAQTLHFVPVKGDDPDEQSELIDRALAMRVDAFVLAPVHPTRVNAAIARINAAGIPLFAFVNPIPADRCVSYVGADDYALGLEIAQYLFAHLQGRGRLLVVSGPVESVSSIARVRAFRDAAAAHRGDRDGRHLRGRLRARNGARRRRAMADGERWLRRLPRGQRRHGPRGGRRAARRGRKAAVAGVNAIPEAIAAIKHGDMLATRGLQRDAHGGAGNRVRRAASSRRTGAGRAPASGADRRPGQLSAVGPAVRAASHSDPGGDAEARGADS